MNIEEVLAKYRGRWDKAKLAELLLEFVAEECISFEMIQFLDRKNADEMIAETGAKR